MGVKLKEKLPQTLTDSYARKTIFQRLRKMGIEKQDITPEMIELEKMKLEGVRTLKKLKKLTKGQS